MKKGKISQNQWNRSVDKKIRYRSKHLVERPLAGSETLTYRLLSETVVGSTMQTETGPAEILGKKAFYRMYNALLAAGTRAEGMQVQLLLPESASEQQIKNIMGQLGEYGAAYEVDIGRVHTEISELVKAPLLTLSGFGKQDVTETGSSRFCPGQQIIMTKWAGAAGAAELAYVNKRSLMKYFPAVYVDEAVEYLWEKTAGESLLSIEKEIKTAWDMGAGAFHNVTKNGVFGALWEMAEMSHAGLEVHFAAIPVRQESIEICEQYGVNLYETDSLGSVLIGAEHGEDLVRRLREEGIPATIIGRVTDGNDRTICRGEETRFLTPP